MLAFGGGGFWFLTPGPKPLVELLLESQLTSSSQEVFMSWLSYACLRQLISAHKTFKLSNKKEKDSHLQSSSPFLRRHLQMPVL